MRFSKEDFLEWKNEHPVSQVFFKFLADEALSRRVLLANGAFNREGNFASIGEEVNKLLTTAEVFEHVKNVEYEDIVDEQQLAGSSGGVSASSEAGEDRGEE